MPDDRDGEFTRYFHRRVESVRGTAHLLCGDWHQAEDLTQAAFLKLYLVWHRLSDRDQLDGYLRRILVRQFLADRRRLRWRREQLTDAPPEVAAGGGADLGDSLLLRRALAAVPARQRAVLVLRYWNDLSVEETAAALRCTTGTVKSHSARGLAALRQRLGEHYPAAWQTGGR